MASLGLFISTLAVGTTFWLAAQAIGAPISFLWSLVFGALISPTDPVAVLSTLKEVNVPHRLQMDMSGESLFNDGVGVVLFVVLLAAASAGEGLFGFGKLAAVIFREAAGGGALGLIAGFIAYRAAEFGFRSAEANWTPICSGSALIRRSHRLMAGENFPV